MVEKILRFVIRASPTPTPQSSLGSTSKELRFLPISFRRQAGGNKTSLTERVREAHLTALRVVYRCNVLSGAVMPRRGSDLPKVTERGGGGARNRSRASWS